LIYQSDALVGVFPDAKETPAWTAFSPTAQ